MSCRRTSTSTSNRITQDTAQGTHNQHDTDSERYTREISYTPNFQSIFSSPHLPQPGSPLLNKPTPSASPGFQHTNHADLLHQQQQPLHLEQSSQNCMPAASQPARPLSQPAPQYSQPTSNGNSPSPHLLPVASPILQNHQQTTSASVCCSISHQASNNQQLMNPSDLYQQHSSIQHLNSYTTVATAAAAAALATNAARAMRNSLYQNIDIQQSQHQTQLLQSAHQMRPFTQQQPSTTINNYHPQPAHNLNYMQDQRIQNRNINTPDPTASDSTNTVPRASIYQATQYQTSQQTAYSQSISLQSQTVNQPTETLAQTYHSFAARRPRGRPPTARQPVTLVPNQQQIHNMNNQSPQTASAPVPQHLMHHLQNHAQPLNNSVPNIRPQTAIRSVPPIATMTVTSMGPTTTYYPNVHRTNPRTTTNTTYSASNNNQNRDIVQQMPRLNNMLSNTRCMAPTTRLPSILQRSADGNLNGLASRRAPPSVQRITEVNLMTQPNQPETRVQNQTAVQQIDQETNPPQTITSCTSTTTNGTLVETNQTEVSAFNATPVSVSSTTRAINLPNKQHVSTQASHEVLNKACQFDGRNIMINKSLNAVVNMLDQVTQTEDETRPTYVDRACSPIHIQHLQQTQPLQPVRMDVPVRRKVTAKRRKVDTTKAEKRKPEPIDSDTEIDILE